MVRPCSYRRPMMLRSTDQSRPLPRIDIGKNRFTSVGLDRRGRNRAAQKWSRNQEAGSPHLIGMEACGGTHHLSCKAWSPCGADAGSLCWQGERGGMRPAIDGAARSARVGPIASRVAPSAPVIRSLRPAATDAPCGSERRESAVRPAIRLQT
jgi:hypothetical protein